LTASLDIYLSTGSELDLHLGSQSSTGNMSTSTNNDLLQRFEDHYVIELPRTIVDWNRLPQTAMLSESVESFRTAITTSHP
jgi:hypothetical protein